MITIKVTIKFQTPINIGSGAQRGTLADRAMIKNHRGWPYVPASALKGRLRHAVEQVAASLGAPVCVTHQNMCPHGGSFCPVCRIFGSPWLPGKLRFARLDLTAPEFLIKRLKERRTPPRTAHRYGVALSRRRGVAEEALLFTTEVMEPGTELTFSGSLTGDLEPSEVALVLAGFRLIPALGRGKSGGLGWCQVETSISGPGTESLSTPAGLRAALAALQAPCVEEGLGQEVSA
jgi:CRISPR-associated protein Csm3